MMDKRKGEKIRAYLLGNEETIAIAESVTSGLLQWQFSNLTDAQNFYQGGVTTYNLGQKYKHLVVEPIHAMSCNCVSAKVAEEMAKNVCTLFNSNWGIGITGYATPVPEADNQLFSYYAICYNGIIQLAGKINSKQLEPEKVQLAYARTVINKLTDCIAKL